VKPRDEDWEILELEPDAELSEVRRAYRRRRTLYETDTLATYNLLEDDERAAMIARIDEAYERIVGAASAPNDPSNPAAAIRPQPPTGPAPDRSTDPGAFLRHHRLQAGLDLHHISTETKISVAILARIEAEDFAQLPAAVFVRGHVQQVARELRLADAEELAKAYVAKMARGEEDD
jgi:hypothetical protein